MVGKVAGHEHGVGPRPDLPHRPHGLGEAVDRPLTGPRGADVRVAELR
jgi:hypothetical protein